MMKPYLEVGRGLGGQVQSHVRSEAPVVDRALETSVPEEIGAGS